MQKRQTSPRTTARRSAFTLIELMVVMAIIAILVALLLPAVQAARQAARNTTVRNRLRQLGLAAHAFHDQHRHFPEGMAAWDGDGTLTPNNQTVSWQYHLLPYLEAGRVYEIIDTGENWADDGPNEGALATQLPVFQSPHTQTDFVVDSDIDTPNGRMPSAYNAVASGTVSTLGLASATDGIYGVGETTIDEITDGTSNTAMFGEVVWSTAGDNFHWAIGSPDITVDARGAFIGTLFPPVEFNSAYLGEFASPNGGGAQFCLADGSVVFLSDTVDSTIRTGYGTKAANATGSPDPSDMTLD